MTVAVDLSHADACETEFFERPLPPMGAPAGGAPWRLRDAEPRIAAALSALGDVEPVLGRALAARGVTPRNLETFLNPSLRASLPEPYLLMDMAPAAERMAEAIVNGQTIGVFGDYDVDGTTASAILYRFVKSAGGDVVVYLPDRVSEGYGPSIEAFRSLRNSGAELIVTVDCGAAAHTVIEEAAGDGLKVIVIDHHQMSGAPPEGALAVVNPQRSDDNSGLEALSAAGLAFITAVAINRDLRQKGWYEQNGRAEPKLVSLLDLTALGLVCDVMPMTGVGRVLTAQGLKILDAGGAPGLAALAKAAGAKRPYSTYTLGFLLGPRINAAGRIGHARSAFQLMVSDDLAECAALADTLHSLNAERQQIEQSVLDAALADIEAKGLASSPVITVSGAGWHQGVIGIVAGRLKERFNKPVFVFSEEAGLAKGSGRSVGGVDLGRAVSQAGTMGLLSSGGGHAMAAGASTSVERLQTFAEFLNDTLADEAAKAALNRRLDVDAVIEPRVVARPLADAVAKVGPFGPGAPEPVFALSELSVQSRRPVGQNHLSVVLVSPAGDVVNAIAFRAIGEAIDAVLQTDAHVHVAGKVRKDDWRGGEAAQFQIVDAAPVAH
ncbi:MAG: single-stranded-DNA-specific exonuclease RecJ [Pseudomonadota bacterium]